MEKMAQLIFKNYVVPFPSTFQFRICFYLPYLGLTRTPTPLSGLFELGKAVSGTVLSADFMNYLI